MAVTYEPIASQTLGSNTATIIFDNIPGTYTDLRLVFVGKYVSASVSNVSFRLNDDTGSNYSTTYLYGTGSSAASARNTSAAYGLMAQMSQTPADSNWIADIMSYANTSVYKTILSSSSAPDFRLGRHVNLWRSTSAITKIQFGYDGSSFASGSIFSLFGVKAA